MNENLAKCYSCGGTVALTAKLCPHCGQKSPAINQKRDAIFKGSFILIALSIVLYQCSDTEKVAPRAIAQSAPPQKSEYDIKFEKAYGVAYGLSKTMKDRSKNPKSFELAEAMIDPETRNACITYRGTNSFNAVVTSRAVSDGSMVAIEGIDGFAKEWNSRCPKATKKVSALLRSQL